MLNMPPFGGIISARNATVWLHYVCEEFMKETRKNGKRFEECAYDASFIFAQSKSV